MNQQGLTKKKNRIIIKWLEITRSPNLDFVRNDSFFVSNLNQSFL